MTPARNRRPPDNHKPEQGKAPTRRPRPASPAASGKRQRHCSYRALLPRRQTRRQRPIGSVEGDPLTDPLRLANWNGSSWTTSTSPIPADSSVQIGSAASSPSYTWLFGTDNTTGEPMILEYS